MKTPSALTAAILLLTACVSPEQQRSEGFRGTENGANIYTFKAGRYEAFMAEQKLNGYINATAKRICPAGWHEVSRQQLPGTSYQNGGAYPVAITTFLVTISCP